MILMKDNIDLVYGVPDLLTQFLASMELKNRISAENLVLVRH